MPTVTEALINGLHPEVALRARALLAASQAAGVPLCVTQGYRSPKEQAALYAKGRTAPGFIVTKAPPGYSWHEFRLAFDVAVLQGVHATWPNDVHLWARIGELGKAQGLDWGGDFHGFVDRPHFEYHPGLTLSQARAGHTLPHVADTEPAPPMEAT